MTKTNPKKEQENMTENKNNIATPKAPHISDLKEKVENSLEYTVLMQDFIADPSPEDSEKYLKLGQKVIDAWEEIASMLEAKALYYNRKEYQSYLELSEAEINLEAEAMGITRKAEVEIIELPEDFEV